MLLQQTGLGRCSWAVLCVALAGCGGSVNANHGEAGSGGNAMTDAGGTTAAGVGSGNASGGAPAGGANAGDSATAGDRTAAGSANAAGEAGTSAGGNGNAGSGGNTAASGNTAAGGSAAGATGTAGSSAVAAACSSLCAELGADCPDGSGGFRQPCQDDCLTTTDVDAPDCRAMGLDMLSCLTAAIHESSSDCGERFFQAKQSCENSVQSYLSCAAIIQHQVPPMTLCAHNARAGAENGKSSCMEDLKCLNNGLINNLACTETDDGKSKCSCYTQGSRRDITVNDVTPTLCSRRFIECQTSGTLTP